MYSSSEKMLSGVYVLQCRKKPYLIRGKTSLIQLKRLSEGSAGDQAGGHRGLPRKKIRKMYSSAEKMLSGVYVTFVQKKHIYFTRGETSLTQLKRLSTNFLFRASALRALRNPKIAADLTTKPGQFLHQYSNFFFFFRPLLFFFFFHTFPRKQLKTRKATQFQINKKKQNKKKISGELLVCCY